MDIIDLWWLNNHDKAINELRDTHTKTAGRTASRIQQLEDENYELRVRVSLLIRLLIERGVFSAEDFTKLLQETKERLAPPAPVRPSPRKRKN